MNTYDGWVSPRVSTNLRVDMGPRRAPVTAMVTLDTAKDNGCPKIDPS